MRDQVSRGHVWLLSVVLGLTVTACDSGRSQKPPAGGSAVSLDDSKPLEPALEATAGSGDETIKVGFDWGPPCRVPAVQEVTKNGVRSRFAFEVLLQREGDRLVAKVDGLRVISADASVRGDVQKAMAVIEGAVPTISVADSGESQGALNVDESINSVMRVLAASRADTKVLDMASQLLRSPQMKAAFAQKAGEAWDVWVGAWTGIELAAGRKREGTYDLNTAVGPIEGVRFVQTHHGRVRDAPKLVLLSFEQTVEGPKLLEVLGGFVKELAARAGSAMPADALKNAKVRKVDRSIVAIDPERGRPHRARHEMEISLDDRRELRTRDTAFDWSRAVGCVGTPPTTGSSTQPAR